MCRYIYSPLKARSSSSVHIELNSTGECLIGRNTLSPRSGKSGSNWRPKNFSGLGAPTGKVKRPASEPETNCSKRVRPSLSRELQSPYVHPRRCTDRASINIDSLLKQRWCVATKRCMLHGCLQSLLLQQRIFNVWQ